MIATFVVENSLHFRAILVASYLPCGAFVLVVGYDDAPQVA